MEKSELMNQSDFERLSQLMADKGVRHEAFELLADLRMSERNFAEKAQAYDRLMTLNEAITHCKENVQKETQNGNLQCAIEHNQLAIWLSQLEESKAKASAYDRLMSGGKKTLKEIANFLGNPVAVDREGRLLWFPRKPEIGLTTWIWYDKYLPKNLIDFNGDWKDSLTLPDGWEEV